jgi:hypothetical protein
LPQTDLPVVKDVASTKPILNTEEPVLRRVSWMSMLVIQKMKLSSRVTEARIIKEIKRRKSKVNIWM